MSCDYTCLSDLVRVGSQCQPSQQCEYYVEQFVDLNTMMLSHLADVSEVSGWNYAQELIAAASNQVWSDLVILAGDGFRLNTAVYTYASPCSFNSTYLNSGSAIVSYMQSNNAEIVVSAVNYKPNFNGSFNLVVSDGVKQETFTINNAQQGVVCTATIDFKTTEKQVTFTCPDASKLFAGLVCKSGCGSCAAKRGQFLSIVGWNGDRTGGNPQAFIPAAYVHCQLDSLYCTIVSKYKSLFAKAIAYKVAEMAYTRLLVSPRLNDTTMNIDRDAAKLYLNTIIGKYQELLYGNMISDSISLRDNYKAKGFAGTTGLRGIIQQALRTIKDQCIICDGQLTTATAVF